MTPPGADKPINFLYPDANTADVFELDYDMLTLRSHATDFEFANTFREGVNYYLAGDWRAARSCLERAGMRSMCMVFNMFDICGLFYG